MTRVNIMKHTKITMYLMRVFKLELLYVIALIGFISANNILIGTWDGYETEYIEGEIAIALAEGATRTDVNNLIEQTGTLLIKDFDTLSIGLLEVCCGQDIFELIPILNNSPLIRFAEPNFVGRIGDHLNDLFYVGNLPPPDDYPHQWGLHNIAQEPPGGTFDADIDAHEAWLIETGNSDIIIGVLDSGVSLSDEGQLDHPDLDDISKYILGGEYSSDDDALGVKDLNSHGTHVLGIIGAETNNSDGIAGMCWGCRFRIIKIINEGSSYTNIDLETAIIEAVNSGCKIINGSFGSTSPSNVVEAAINFADSAGVLQIYAVGNFELLFQNVKWPAKYAFEGSESLDHQNGYKSVIAVASTTANDKKSWFSNYDPGENHISVAAPGGDFFELGPNSLIEEYNVFSTMPTYITETLVGPNETMYGYKDGTSMATPLVSGLAGLILSVNQDFSAKIVKEIIQKTAEDVNGTEYPGIDEFLGYGRINAYQAVLMAKYMADHNILNLHTGEVNADIQENTLLVGEISIENNVNVENDVELHFYPGTSITISHTVDLNIEGSLVALGTADEPIFISGGNGIYTQNADVELSHVSFDNTNLIYLSSSTGIVDNSSFNTNLATVVDGGDFEFNHSTFTGTLAGLVAASMPTEPRISVDLNNCTFENSPIGLATTYRAITTIKNCEFINNETGIFSDSFSEPWLFQENEDYGCEGNNNTIIDNDIGFGVYQDAQPWLGIYSDLANYFEGHNRIDNTTDIQNSSWHQRPIYAQVNNWNSGTNCYPSSPNNLSGGPVISSPTVYDVYYEGPITWEDYIVLRLEAGGEYSEASAIYQQIIEDNPNSPHALWALAGLARCMEKNGQLHELIELFEYYVITFSGTQIEKYARSYGITSQIVKGDYDKAATMIASFESDYPSSEFEPKIRYESTILYKILQGSSNGRTIDNMSEKIQAEYHFLSANHPETGLGILATILLGDEQTTSSSLAEVPDSYSLVQVYPNPFNPITNITYDIPEDSFVSIVVYDLAGRKVDDLVSGIVQSGRYNITWNADQFSSGVYFVTMTAPSFTSTQKVVLLK